MSSDMPIETIKNEKSQPTSRVNVSKDEAAKMKVGSSICLSLEGEVKSLHPSYDDKEMYEVEIENPTVTVEGDDNDESDEKYNMATMPRKELKKKIMKSADDEE